MRRFRGLRRTVDFQRLRRQGRRIPTGALLIIRSDAAPGDETSLVGISIKKSIGKAVIRNKIRRRLAAILDERLAGHVPVRLILEARPEAARRHVRRAARRRPSRADMKHAVIFLLQVYRRVVSPLLPPACRFYPSLLGVRHRRDSLLRRLARRRSRRAQARALPSVASRRRGFRAGARLPFRGKVIRASPRLARMAVSVRSGTLVAVRASQRRDQEPGMDAGRGRRDHSPRDVAAQHGAVQGDDRHAEDRAATQETAGEIQRRSDQAATGTDADCIAIPA